MILHDPRAANRWDHLRDPDSPREALLCRSRLIEVQFERFSFNIGKPTEGTGIDDQKQLMV
jgi:hypothetical protein